MGRNRPASLGLVINTLKQLISGCPAIPHMSTSAASTGLHPKHPTLETGKTTVLPSSPLYPQPQQPYPAEAFAGNSSELVLGLEVRARVSSSKEPTCVGGLEAHVRSHLEGF